MNLPRPLQSLMDRLLDTWPQARVLLKAMSFATIGVLNVLVDVAFFTLACLAIVGLGYAATSEDIGKVALVLANAFAWSIAVSGSYVMNSLVTFARETGRKLRLRSYLTFVASGLAGLGVGTAVLLIGNLYLPLWTAKGVAILASFVVNFSMSHFVVFRHRPVPFEHDVV